jgi:hypothetical protein
MGRELAHGEAVEGFFSKERRGLGWRVRGFVWFDEEIGFVAVMLWHSHGCVLGFVSSRGDKCDPLSWGRWCEGFARMYRYRLGPFRTSRREEFLGGAYLLAGPLWFVDARAEGGQ